MHRLFLFALILILLISNAYSWEQFQNNELNNGKANGTGYFNAMAITSLNDSLNGMNFQPLISDINNDGKNEIIVFSGNYLKILDNELSLIGEQFTGKLQGQPVIFNIDNDNFKEIIFISNISNVDYFFAYEYNKTGFNQEFNFTVPNGGIGSGIKCTGIGTTDICIFMDNAQYLHIFNLTSKTDSSYNTSAHTNTRERIPAIADLHNNGSLQAVFLFDENNNNQYGLMAFDLINKNFDFSFNNGGIVDDIIPSSSTSYVLKGHPVLADLNNDNKLEIAISAFYDDATGGEMRSDWLTHLFAYNSSGSKLFSVCEERSSGNCNDGSGTESRWEGTNPFVLDSDSNGIDDICFIKDKKISGDFKNMTINCYNYSGSKILDSEIAAGTIKTATAADMNNDGILDIVTENNIYYKNGSSFFTHNFGSNFAIPADIDGNGGLDLLLSKKSLTQIFIDNFGSVKVSNVSISPMIPSSDDSLSCSFVVEGNGILKANVSWYKNNILQSMEDNIECINGSVCSVLNPVPSSSIAKNDVWKCSVAGFNESFKSYTRNSKVKVLGKSSEWADYCNSNDDSCTQSGISYFSNAGADSISNNTEGMEFEPLAADINNDGKNEIIIFSNENLIIYNNSLGLINKKNVGSLIGQPAIYNIDSDNNLEIIFNVNVSSTSYFMAYKYNNNGNNNFTKKCNVTISNGASGSGIKCADIGNAKACFFKDQKNVFYNFNMSNSCKQIANLTTNNNEDTTPTVPSILDYDLDGKMEGLWRFNNDSDAYNGIAVIELETMKFDTGFNNIGFIDDVIDGSSDFRYTAGYENVKGNPTFYQQDNAGGYEILIAWDNERYFHAFSGHTCYRSNLKLFDTDGTLLWKNTPATGCPIGSTGTYNCDISTPVLVDADKDGYDDVCFIMNGGEACYTNAPEDYFYCLDRFGTNVEGYPKNTSDVSLYGSYSASIDTQMYIADMDNDNELEMIGSGYIWNLNGTILKGNYSSFTKFAPVPVDIDKNGVLELLGSKVNETIIFQPNADVCSGRIQVQSADYNNNYVPNTNIFVNNVLKGTTNDFGLFESKESGICTNALSYIVKCSNNSVICETKTITLDIDGGFKGVPFDCSICGSESDMELKLENIKTNKNGNQVTANITIINIPATDNINITFKVQGNDGLISKEESQLFNITSNDRFKFITQSINLEGDFVHVYADSKNDVIETDEKNNYVLVPLFEKQIDAYLNISTGYEKVDDKIKEYLTLFVNEKPKNEADVTLCIGKKCSQFDYLNDFTWNSIFKSQKFGYKNDQLIFEGKNVGGKPYNAIVGGFWKDTDGKNYVMAYGNDIDGDIAAVKKLISARSLFLNKDLLQEDRTKVIDDFDAIGISVADLLRNPNNFPYYTQRNSEQFSRVVERILNDNNFEVDIKTVKTLNTTSYNSDSILRLKNVNSDFSQNYKEAISKGTKPVVMSGGIFSNLVSWEGNGNGLAVELANEGYDVWEIEMNGGKNTECTDCPDYTYQDQSDYFWPALVAGVMRYSGKNQIDYIGHSNGCRVALSSLNSYSNGKNSVGWVFNTETGQYDIITNLPNNPVDKFFGVACPTTLNNLTGMSELARELKEGVPKGDIAMKEIREKGIKHIEREEYGKRLLLRGWIFGRTDKKISTNLMDFYNNISIEIVTQFLLKPNIVNQAILFGGSKGFPTLNNFGDDGVVPLNDMQNLNNNLNNSKLYIINKNHGELIIDENFKKVVKGELNG